MHETLPQLTRIRVLIQEAVPYADALADHLRQIGRPVWCRDPSVLQTLDGAASASGDPGRVFEYLAEPPDLLQVIEAVHRPGGVAADFRCEFHFMHPPALVCRRVDVPADPARPFQGLEALLAQLPPALSRR